MRNPLGLGGDVLGFSPFIGVGLTGVAVLQDKPRYIIAGGAVLTVFFYNFTGTKEGGGTAEPLELFYKHCERQGYFVDAEGKRTAPQPFAASFTDKSANSFVRTGPDICKTNFSPTSAVFYASAAMLAWGVYRATEKGL